eukprot:CAMPEP_0181100616 /NCGR_PEP_ID=MMETSP1071-20121207/13290_1 /TAXON_ID=35127 /ORGANISM="Thalassiosira sp., Strain NH16" /LENGTH=296 /DNA_ID=CAMNT_0023183361 /DNA_START=105 /DNA_END=992 /DNA_ORIENTATION=+
MVEISEVIEEATAPTASASSQDNENDNNAAASRADERLSDADEIEAASSSVSSPTARLHLENLVTKLRREGKALRRVAASASSADNNDDDDDETKKASIPQSSSPAPAPAPKRTPAKPFRTPTSRYQSFPTYYFDAGKYDSPIVSVMIPLEGVGRHDRDKITCEFTSGSFDLIVKDWEAGDDEKEKKSYRLLNDNLDKDIDVAKSKLVIKANKLIIKLGKVKGEYGLDSWTALSSKKAKTAGGAKKKDDPTAGIMDMMKDMYEDGDDNMKKMIGETMYKQRMGQLNKDDPMGGMGG